MISFVDPNPESKLVVRYSRCEDPYYYTHRAQEGGGTRHRLGRVYTIHDCSDRYTVIHKSQEEDGLMTPVQTEACG